MAGQSVGMVTAEQSTSDIIAELIDQAVTALAASAERGAASIDGGDPSTNLPLPASA